MDITGELRSFAQQGARWAERATCLRVQLPLSPPLKTCSHMFRFLYNAGVSAN